MQRAPVRKHSPVCSLSVALALCAPALCFAQSASPASAEGAGVAQSRDIPRPDQLEPAVATSSATKPVPASSGASGAATPPPAPSGSGAVPRAAAAPRTSAATSKTAPHPRADRLELDATDITGNRELPKVLYIVPWKRSDLGDLVGKPVNSLLDEVLQPLDRDVFQRENRYYDALKPDAVAPKAGAVQGSGDKP
ncbi:MAG TPA: hypothetical protein VEH54_06330 [Steroidobacteraceae bacterium]|nr:hypothetical protein [Steroidobacteraceae bacterium]